MNINPKHFAIQIPYIKAWLDAKPGFNLDEEIGPLAVATGVHIVALTNMVGEMYGFTPHLEAKLKRYMQFYQIDTLGEE